jgi:hypothetical protein
VAVGGGGFDQDDVLPVEEAGEIALSKDKDKDAPTPLTGKPGIGRQYGLLGDGFDQDGSNRAVRAERAAKYERDMKPYEHAKLEAARGELVKAFKASPGKWPDGIDSKYDRWYRPDEWDAEGVYIGERPCIKPLNPDQAINTPAEKTAKLSAARAALASAEARLGVKPVKIETETVTKLPSATVTKLPSATVTKLPTGDGRVTKHAGGRPAVSEQPMTAAERARRARAKKAQKKDGE